jgi:hypothetical protein
MDFIIDYMMHKLEKKIIELTSDMKQELAENFLVEAARFKIVPLRIRGGKIQRRRKISTAKGFEFRGHIGHQRLVRITPNERIRRRIGARRAKIKRNAHRTQIALHYRRSIRRRSGLGLGR